MAAFRELEARDGTDGQTACREAARAVAEGSLLAHPTSTVYGIGGLADRETDERIGALKGRSPERAPLLRVAPDVPTLLRALPGVRWDHVAEELARAFWPGPLTLVLDDGSASGTAVRVESHPVLRQVLFELDGVMSSTSLNLAGQPPATTLSEARHVLEKLPGDQEPIVLVASGDLEGPPPSTLVSLLGPTARILREGAVAEPALRRVLLEQGRA